MSVKYNNKEIAALGRRIASGFLSVLGVNIIEVLKENGRDKIRFKHRANDTYYVLTIKTRTSGDWQPSIAEGKKREQIFDERRYWIFVDLRKELKFVECYIVPEWWIENNIYVTHKANIAKYGGRRKKSPNSIHHGVKTKRIAQWKNRWDLLGI